MHAGVVGELFELGSAGEAVREDHGAYSCSADGGQQRGLRDRHRDVVVAAFDTKITSQTAATADTWLRCREKSRITPLRTALPAMEVPAPRETRGTPSSRQTSIAAAASSRCRGKTTAAGTSRYLEASEEYSARHRVEKSTSATPALRSAAATSSETAPPALIVVPCLC